MKQLEEIGTCPICGGCLMLYKTSNYKRFVKCDSCEISYPVPQRGNINNSALECPNSGFPVLIIDRPHQTSYFWADRPCFGCLQGYKCPIVIQLITEFKDLEVHGY